MIEKTRLDLGPEPTPFGLVSPKYIILFYYVRKTLESTHAII